MNKKELASLFRMGKKEFEMCKKLRELAHEQSRYVVIGFKDSEVNFKGFHNAEDAYVFSKTLTFPVITKRINLVVTENQISYKKLDKDVPVIDTAGINASAKLRP